MLGNVLKSNLIEQIKDFLDSIDESFKIITKNHLIDNVKRDFIENEKELKKDKNIPEDDDCSIIAGYRDYDSEGKKNLISEDEHFWGYKELIRGNYNIYIVEEWNCDQLIC